MAFDPHANLALSTVATAPSPATSGTTLTPATHSYFPDPASVGAYNVTVWENGQQPTPANAEIIRITAKSGAGVLTITRAQESTVARSVVIGDQIAIAPTKKTFTDIEAGVAWQVLVKSADYAITAADALSPLLVYVQNTATITLPLVNSKLPVTVIRTGGTVTIARNSSDVILLPNGTSTTALVMTGLYQNTTFIPDGTNWLVLTSAPRYANAARATNSGAHSIPNNVETALTFDTETFDVPDMHSTSSNTSRFVAIIAGIYQCTGHAVLAANAGGGQRGLFIKKNGTTYYSLTDFFGSANGACRMFTTALVNMAAGDYIEFFAYQDSGGALNATSQSGAVALQGI